MATDKADRRDLKKYNTYTYIRMDLQSLLEVDRNLLHFFNGSNNMFLDSVVSTLTSGITWIPLYLALLCLIIKNNETMSQIMLIIGCSALCILLADGVADGLAKPYFARLRPTNDPFIKYSIDVVHNYRGDDFGFFSAHAANTMSIAVFFCLLIRNRLLSFTLVLWSLINSWTRLYLGVHYPSDIICGLFWGCVSGFLSYIAYHYIYRKISTNANYISTQYTATGYDINEVNVVLTVLAFTFVYVVLNALLSLAY